MAIQPQGGNAGCVARAGDTGAGSQEPRCAAPCAAACTRMRRRDADPSGSFGAEGSSRDGRSAARYAWRVNAKEKLLELAPHWSEEQAERALRAVEGTDTSDDWGDVSKVHEVSVAKVMGRLAAEERAAGHEPW